MRTVCKMLPLAVLAAMILGIVGCGSSASNAEIADTVKKVGGAYDGMAESARPFDRAMIVGQVVLISDKADVTLQAVSRDTTGWPSPGTGNELVVLDLTLANRGSVALDLQPLAQYQLTDLANNMYPALEVKGFGTPDAGKLALAPASSSRGQVAFALPAGSRHVGFVWAQIAPAILIVDGLESG
jgi:hypothetical protein